MYKKYKPRSIALSAGALAVLEKPAGPGHPKADQHAASLVKMVKLMSEVKVITRKTSLRKKETVWSKSPGAKTNSTQNR